ncbi:SLAM family member 7-like [Passer domesticus]|uniref:SLAM family member 7-like n=1 Tax=Passer domesticus TaxID=48849 RepID=UPI0030FE49E0
MWSELPLLDASFSSQTTSKALPSTLTLKSHKDTSSLFFLFLVLIFVCWCPKSSPFLDTHGHVLDPSSHHPHTPPPNHRALSISQLRMEDAGTYSVTIDTKRSTFTLQLFGELAEPMVTCEAQNCSDGSCSFSLRCSTPGASLRNVSYSWRVRDQPWDGDSVVLRVNESSREEPETLTCMAWNPVSSRSFTVTIPGVLCSGESWGQVGKGGMDRS